eukprot:Blabericola_migrator_1__4@NODE_1001_length_5735_cov_490_698659_g689_i0_p2_GENE_NODE_1001_length_5735_cov_490_698659_g689_i0NODE_1001_length_5735_cov_490_698659_g689_i0_p2_ORF_typecomplete_len386_score31_57Galactosyl_T/PF01762_21/9_3e27Fringe/PF02434_16/0_14Fringe/PF02434_16/1_8e03_NODE_1001_length_5735_cov_490_698659_g689_i0831240
MKGGVFAMLRRRRKVNTVTCTVFICICVFAFIIIRRRVEEAAFEASLRELRSGVWSHLVPIDRSTPLNASQPPLIRPVRQDYVEHIIDTIGKARLMTAQVNMTELLDMPLFARFLVEPSPKHFATVNATVFLMTIPTQREERNKIRAMHRSLSAPYNHLFRVSFIFTVGIEHNGVDLSGELLEEAAEYQDLLVLDYLDTWTVYTTKVLSSIYYFTTHVTSPHTLFLKIDDDVVVNWARLQLDLTAGQSLPPKPFWYGEVLPKSKNQNPWKHKHYELLYEGPFPPYADGPLSMMDQETARLIVRRRVFHYPLPFKNDDALIGLLVNNTDVAVTDVSPVLRTWATTCKWWWVPRNRGTIRLAERCLAETMDPKQPGFLALSYFEGDG